MYVFRAIAFQSKHGLMIWTCLMYSIMPASGKVSNVWPSMQARALACPLATVVHYSKSRLAPRLL